MYIEKYFNSDITALWNVYYRMLIATIQIRDEEESRKIIKKYSQLFENIHLKWTEGRLFFFIIFLFPEFINPASRDIAIWKAKMKKKFRYLF